MSRHPYLAYAYQLENIEGIRNLPGYEKGYFVVQDVSSMLVTEVAAVESEEQILVLDVCAAPGGKSLHMAEKLGAHGKVVSRDLTEYKVSLIRDNIERLNYENIVAEVFDALVLDESLIGKADVVLADLPCSGLGIMGKKRDIKYRMTPELLKELEELQKQILEMVWQYVKPGGILIYSTCTINPGENQDQVKWFLEEHPFELESLLPLLPEPLKEEGKGGMLQLLPGVHETDGFFMARMKRKIRV